VLHHDCLPKKSKEVEKGAASRKIGGRAWWWRVLDKGVGGGVLFDKGGGLGGQRKKRRLSISSPCLLHSSCGCRKNLAARRPQKALQRPIF
jgi:hypothetical protein